MDIEFKRGKALNFVTRGYSVEWQPNTDNWITAYIPGDLLNAQRRIEAAAKFYPVPSSYGIDEGCISKLCIRSIAENLGDDRKHTITLYNYDRGLDIDDLKLSEDAMRLYEAVLFELN